MASGFSVYAGNKVLDKLMKAPSVDFVVPTSYWVALFTNSGAAAFLRVNDIASAQECSGGAYARVEVRGATSITWATAVNAATEQTGDISFTQATASWGTVYTAALMDALTAGNVWMYGDLPAPKAVAAPDIFRIPSTFFDLSL